MREPNTRVRPPRERFELSLDGRQVASAVVGALVLLAVVFVLGLEVGKQIASRRAERTPAGDLEALDRAPPQAQVKDESLTFHDRLTKDAPAQLPPAPAAPHERAAPSAAPLTSPKAGTISTPTPTPTSTEPANSTAVHPERSASAEAEARSRRAPTETAKSSTPAPRARAVPAKPWTVQLAAAQDRAEAERLAGRFPALNPRVEEADVPGKGRFYRVRVGGFETKESAERYLRDVARETGAKGFVTPTR